MTDFEATGPSVSEAFHPPVETEEGIAAPADLPPLSLWSRGGFLLTSMVAGLSSVCIKQLLLPLQVSILDPTNTTTSFALVSVLGALAGLLAAPLTGALADRTTSRWGRRRPWLFGGILIGVAGLLLMAWSPSIGWLILGEILEQLGVDAVLSNVTALIPEQIPERQRAQTSALNGMAPIVGGVAGLVLVTTLTDPHLLSQGYLLLAILSVLCVGSFLVVFREQPLPQTDVIPLRVLPFLTNFLHPLRSRDFVLTLLSRFLIFLCYTLLGSYLLFYLRDGLHTPVTVAARGVTTYQLTSTAVLIVTALLAGSLSRRSGRLKPFICVGALVMAVGVLVLILFPAWSGFYTAAALFGAGFGLYLGTDIALAVSVLPSSGSRGKDLGIIYTSIFLPLIVTPILGASILNHVANGFALLFTVAALASLLAAVLILPVRSVR